MWDDFSGSNPTLESKLEEFLQSSSVPFKQEVNFRMEEVLKGQHVSEAVDKFFETLAGSDITVNRDMTGAVLIHEELDRIADSLPSRDQTIEDQIREELARLTDLSTQVNM